MAFRCSYGKHHGRTDPYPSSYRDYRGSGQSDPGEKNTIASSMDEETHKKAKLL